MTTGEVIIAFATLAGPIAAVQVQKFIERSQARRERKLAVFMILMAGRGSPLSPASVQALNMVEIEFAGKRVFGRSHPTATERDVIAAWTLFFSHANSSPTNERWAEQFNDHLVTLLARMGADLNYKLEAADIKWHTYSPRSHVEDEELSRAVKIALAQLLTGHQALKVRLDGSNPPPVSNGTSSTSNPGGRT